MKKVCWLLVGFVNNSWGMNLNFRIDRGSLGLVRVCECNAREFEDLGINQSAVFRGFTFGNLDQGEG